MANSCANTFMCGTQDCSTWLLFSATWSYKQMNFKRYSVQTQQLKMVKQKL
jgi:hypothetical protein